MVILVLKDKSLNLLCLVDPNDLPLRLRRRNLTLAVQAFLVFLEQKSIFFV